MLSPRINSSAGKASSQPSMRRLVAKLGPEGATAVRVAVSAMSIARSFSLGAPPTGTLSEFGSRESKVISILDLRLTSYVLRLVVRALQRLEVLVRLHL